jgi:hypothetical protein
MSTMNAKPIRPTHPEITMATDRRLAGELKLHYQICRHLDEQLDAAYRETMQDERFSEIHLNKITRERNEAHEIYRLYLSEYIRRRKQEHLQNAAR